MTEILRINLRSPTLRSTHARHLATPSGRRLPACTSHSGYAQSQLASTRVHNNGGYPQSSSAQPILSERGVPVRSSWHSLDWRLSFDHAAPQQTIRARRAPSQRRASRPAQRCSPAARRAACSAARTR
eukprot:1031659-Pleurochrysis_carterae.AAC.1